MFLRFFVDFPAFPNKLSLPLPDLELISCFKETRLDILVNCFEHKPFTLHQSNEFTELGQVNSGTIATVAILFVCLLWVWAKLEISNQSCCKQLHSFLQLSNQGHLPQIKSHEWGCSPFHSEKQDHSMLHWLTLNDLCKNPLLQAPWPFWQGPRL